MRGLYCYTIQWQLQFYIFHYFGEVDTALVVRVNGCFQILNPSVDLCKAILDSGGEAIQRGLT